MITNSPHPSVTTTGAGTTALIPNVADMVTATDNVGVTSKTQSPEAGTAVISGVYNVVVTVSDAEGNSAQTTVQVTVNDPVIFTTQPNSTFVHEGSATSFTVAVSGTEPLNYQWEHNTVPITYATEPTLTITDAKATDGGSYRCVVTNVAGSETSDPATLEVRLHPRITAPPKSQEVRPKATVEFSVQATGYAPLTYQWRKDGSDLPDQTGPELMLTNVTNANAGFYTVVVTNEVKSVESEAAELRVIVWADVDGTYQSLLVHDNTANPDEQPYRGRLTVTLTNLGAMTGKLEYQGLTYAFTGKLTPELNYQRTILRKNQGALNLTMHLDASDLMLSVSVVETLQSGNLESGAEIPIHKFHSQNNPAPQAGRYTMRFNLVAGGTGGPDEPAYAVTGIAKSGKVNMTGKLPDGSTLSCSAFLREDGSSGIYDGLYKAKHPYAGFIAGPMTFDPEAGLLAVTGVVNWEKPAQTSGAYWALGFKQTRDIEGSFYTPPVRDQRVLNLPSASDVLTMTVSGLSAFTHTLNLTTGNQFLVDVPNPRKLTVNLRKPTGLVSGTFFDPTLRKTRKLTGVALQAQGEINGFFLGDTDAGEWMLAPP